MQLWTQFFEKNLYLHLINSSLTVKNLVILYHCTVSKNIVTPCYYYWCFFIKSALNAFLSTVSVLCKINTQPLNISTKRIGTEPEVLLCLCLWCLHSLARLQTSRTSMMCLQSCGGLSGFRYDGQGFNVIVIAESAEFALMWRCPKRASLNTSRAASVYCLGEQYTPFLCVHTHTVSTAVSHGLRPGCSIPEWREHCVSHTD